MKTLCIGLLAMIFMAATPVAMPVTVHAEIVQTATGGAIPPVSQQLVREGDFAITLATALNLGVVTDEVTAENRLTEAGIMPRNGWIADYPVTPDIINELATTVKIAALNGRIAIDSDQAVYKFNDVLARSGLQMTPNSAGSARNESAPVSYTPPSDVVNNYYYTDGPPVVTYYTPPPDYYNMYAWVPYPFWYFDFWFPGYFILNDFHRPCFIGSRWVYISNHFRDDRGHWRGRIDPVTRAPVTVTGQRHDKSVSRPAGGPSTVNQPAVNHFNRAPLGTTAPRSTPVYRGGETRTVRPAQAPPATFNAPRSVPATRSGGFSGFFREHGTMSFGGGASSHAGFSTGVSGGFSPRTHRF